VIPITARPEISCQAAGDLGDEFMKHTCLALILALTVASWAQTSTQPTPSTSTPDRAKCACCDKIASAKDGASCQRHGMNDATGKASCCAGKDAASCCGGKDGKSCMNDEKASTSCCKDGCGKEKTAASCCGNRCGKDEKSCCSGKDEKTAMNCCTKHQHS